MANEYNCIICKHGVNADDYEHCPNCDKGSEFVRMSNADRIRSMSDKEMARDLIPLIEEICEDGVPCEELFLSWLQSEVE